MGGLLDSAKHAIRLAKRSVSEHAPQILLVSGIAGTVSATVLGIRATWVFKDKIQTIEQSSKYQRDIPEDGKEQYVRKEVFKAALRLYLPVLLTLGGGVTCILVSRKLVNDRQVALATAYTALSETLETYQEKIAERLGEEDYKEFEDEVHEKLSNEVDLNSYPDGAFKPEGHGDTLYFDRVTGRWFYATPTKVRAAEAEIAKRCSYGESSTIDDFYELIGISDFTQLGAALGWDGYHNQISVYYGSRLTNGDVPCVVISYEVQMLDEDQLKPDMDSVIDCCNS